jgi:hypothetical protein
VIFCSHQKNSKRNRERDVNTLGGNTFGLLEEAYTWVIKKRLTWVAEIKGTLIILKSMIM